MTTNELINDVVALAKEVDVGGSIVDFGLLSLDEDAIFNLMASNVIEGYLELLDGNLIAMATITALLVENFVLNVQLQNMSVHDS